nr:glycosyltransferase [uncultured Dethiosulfovibrio sp.]
MDETKRPKIATVLLSYDYGLPERGPSLERGRFFPAICDFADVTPFWLEENGYPEDLEGLQDRIVGFVEEERPDVVFTITMRDEISCKTLDRLKEISFVVNWFCDDQWRFDDYSSKRAPLLSGAMTVDLYSLPKYREMGVPAVWVPWGIRDFAEELSLRDVKYDFDVSFIGGADRNRRWWIKRIEALTGSPVACFGSGWKGGRVSDQDVMDIMLKSRINLNLSNSRNNDIRFVLSSPVNVLKYLRSGKNQEQVKARNIEIPAFGGFELSCYAPGIERYFSIGDEIDLFTSPEEAAVKIAYYLLDEKRRESMKLKAYHRAKRDYHLGTVILEGLKKLGVSF